MLESTRALIEQIAILHYFGVQASCSCTAADRSSLSSPKSSACPRAWSQGRRVTDQGSIDVTSMVLNGLINTRVLAICRDLNISTRSVSAASMPT